MTSSLTSGGHYPDRHPAYNIYDLSPNIVSSFNNYSKSWLMHAYNIRAISGDDLIIEVSGNNRIIFQENDHSYNLCDLTGFKVLNKNLTATDANVRIPISYNNYSFADPTSLLTSLTLNGSYVDLTGAGYTLKYAPSTINSKVHVRAKINYKSSAGTEQLITFRLMRDISGGSTGGILMTDSSLGSITGVTSHGIYNLEYLDSPGTEEDVRYYLKFRIEAADSDIVVSSGVLGYNDENQNFFSAQEIYIPGTYQYTPKDCACEQLTSFQETLVVAGGSGTNTLVYSLNNGEGWIGLGSGVITNTCNDIVWSSENEKFIGVGSGANTIVYSSREGNEWRDVSLSTSIFSTAGNGVTWSGFRYVAVGEGTNSIAHSGDGLYWRAVPSSTSIFSTRGNKVAYGNNRFIAVGEGTNTIAYSDDGMNWVGLGNSIFSTAGYSIIWNGERWVAGGEGTNTLAISNDNGYSWIGLGIVPFSTKVMGLATNDISMVAVGSGLGGGATTIAYSSNNGLSWTQATSVFASSSTGTSVSWIGDRFIATSNDTTHTTAYSYDAINWTGLGNSELSTIANAVSTNKSYENILDNYRLFSIDVSLRHLDLSGKLVCKSTVGINTDSPVVTLDISSNDALKIPVGNDNQRPLPAELGSIRYNNEIHTYEGFGSGGAWGSLGGVKDVDGDTYILAETSAGDDNDDLEFYTAGIKYMTIEGSGNIIIGRDLSNMFTISGETGNTFIGGDASLNKDLYLGGTLYTEKNFIIDPKGHNDNTGLVIIRGGLQIDGSSTIINSSVLDVGDHKILLSSTSTNQSQTDGAGIEVSNNKLFVYNYDNDYWSTNIGLNVSGILIVEDDVSLYKAVDISGKFNINGDTSLNAPVDINNKFNVNGDSSLNGSVDISNKLVVNGNVSLNSSVDISNKLVVNGDSSLNGSVDISNKLVVNGDSSFNGDVDISGTLKADNILFGEILKGIGRFILIDACGNLVDSSFISFDGSNLIIDTSSSIQVPVGTSGERPFPSKQGQIRYNIDDSTFEGYDGSSWGSLGGVKDVNGNTYILAETSAGADNDELEFYTAGTKYMTIDGCGNIIVGSNMFTISAETGYTFIAGDISMNNNVDISGNLTVSGDTILSNAYISDLSNSCIVFTGENGKLIDSSFLTFDSSFNLVIDTSSSIQIPVGTSGERPFPSKQGQIRYNIDDSTFEGYDGSSWGSLGGNDVIAAVYASAYLTTDIDPIVHDTSICINNWTVTSQSSADLIKTGNNDDASNPDGYFEAPRAGTYKVKISGVAVNGTSNKLLEVIMYLYKNTGSGYSLYSQNSFSRTIGIINKTYAVIEAVIDLNIYDKVIAKCLGKTTDNTSWKLLGYDSTDGISTSMSVYSIDNGATIIGNVIINAVYASAYLETNELNNNLTCQNNFDNVIRGWKITNESSPGSIKTGNDDDASNPDGYFKAPRSGTYQIKLSGIAINGATNRLSELIMYLYKDTGSGYTLYSQNIYSLGAGIMNKTYTTIDSVIQLNHNDKVIVKCRGKTSDGNNFNLLGYDSTDGIGTHIFIYSVDNGDTQLPVVDSDISFVASADISGNLTIANAFTLPTTAGSSGQIMTYPSSGKKLEWTTPNSNIYGGAGCKNQTSIINSSNDEYNLEYVLWEHTGCTGVELANDTTSGSGTSANGITLSTRDAMVEIKWKIHIMATSPSFLYCKCKLKLGRKNTNWTNAITLDQDEHHLLAAHPNHKMTFGGSYIVYMEKGDYVFLTVNNQNNQSVDIMIDTLADGGGNNVSEPGGVGGNGRNGSTGFNHMTYLYIKNID